MASGRRGPSSGKAHLVVSDGRAADLGELLDEIDEYTRNEIRQDSKETPRRALYRLYSLSDVTWTVRNEGRIASMGGTIVGEAQNAKNIWLLCTEHVAPYSIEFIHIMRKLTRTALQTTKILYGFVDDRSHKRKRWLERIGFTMAHSTTPMTGIADEQQEPFRLFLMRREEIEQ